MSIFDRFRGRRPDSRSAPRSAPPRAAAPADDRPLNLGVPEPDAARELVLYKFDTCPFCVRVMRNIDALGVEMSYEDTRKDPTARQALIDATGRTQVPCLFVDGQPLFESADINRWINRYAANGFAA